ncbi:MAG: thioredoxin family protein [Planctomycetia bacterium]|nr:thioredoxin family protein [Planctomycetia bacterium]
MRSAVAIAAILVVLTSGCGPTNENAGGSRVAKLREAVVEKLKPAKPVTVEPAELKYYDDLPAALAQAKVERKPLLLIFAADWCFHSRQLLTEVLTRNSVRPLTDRFICVRIDVDRSPELCAEYRVRAYPTLVFASPSGAALSRLTGAQQDEVVTQEMTAALTTVADRLAMPPSAAPLQR